MFHRFKKTEHPRSVLIFEDNKHMLKLLIKILETRYAAHGFSNVADAINWLSKSNCKPDVILSDIQMEEIDGIQFVQFLNTSGLFENIPVFFLTAKEGDELEKLLLTVRFDGIIRKPFNPEDLIAKLEAKENLLYL
jgi:CheY-like chemotaxis protein